MKKKFQRVQKKMMKRLKPVLDFTAAMDKKNIAVMAAGIAYFTLLAVFPGVAAGMAIALFLLEPTQVEAVMVALSAYLPEEITSMLTVVLSRQADAGSDNLVMAAVGIAIALFGASGAMQNMTKALNTVFAEKETRNMVRLRLISIALTIGVILVAAMVIALLLFSQGQLVRWGVPEWLAIMIAILRWPAMFVVINAALLALFRYGANRETAPRSFITPGGTAATLLWLVITAGFFWYLQHFAGFAQSYSVFAGIIALMMWFNFSAMAILIGALVDARYAKH